MSAVKTRTYKAKRRDSAWDKVKRKGSGHYKGQTEPIDLFRAGHILYPYAIGNIIKYAYRQRAPLSVEKIIADMDKVIHYAEIVKAIAKEVALEALGDSILRSAMKELKEQKGVEDGASDSKS